MAFAYIFLLIFKHDLLWSLWHHSSSWLFIFDPPDDCFILVLFLSSVSQNREPGWHNFWVPWCIAYKLAAFFACLLKGWTEYNYIWYDLKYAYLKRYWKERSLIMTMSMIDNTVISDNVGTWMQHGRWWINSYYYLQLSVFVTRNESLSIIEKYIQKVIKVAVKRFPFSFSLELNISLKGHSQWAITIF